MPPYYGGNSTCYNCKYTFSWKHLKVDRIPTQHLYARKYTVVFGAWDKWDPLTHALACSYHFVKHLKYMAGSSIWMVIIKLYVVSQSTDSPLWTPVSSAVINIHGNYDYEDLGGVIQTLRLSKDSCTSVMHNQYVCQWRFVTWYSPMHWLIDPISPSHTGQVS